MSARYRFGLILALALQLGLLGWMIADRALILKNGREIELAVVPVDPRDIFRGDFVTLSYEISQLYSSQLAGDDFFRDGDTIYVGLEEGPDGLRPASMSHDEPADGLFLRGTVTDADKQEGCETACWHYRVQYNIEQYFVAEGQGKELEAARNARKVSVVVAVTPHGRSALKRLLLDGVVRDEQPIY